MQIKDHLLAELEREAARSRKALERMPEGKADWKPHDKSMAFGYLSQLVATMPSWVAMMVNQDELDLNPPGGGGPKPQPLTTRDALVGALDKAAADARAALQNTTDDHLMTKWRLLVAGNVVAEDQRCTAIADTFAHLAHHRGQMTVYLRLLGAPVPALYGPSADDRSFA
jgi:uncharacterized damage-inducible protein DinB